MMAADSSKKFQIFINTLTTRTITLDVCCDLDMEFVKWLIEEKEGIQITHQQLIFGGKQLENDRTLAGMNIAFGDVGIKQLMLPFQTMVFKRKHTASGPVYTWRFLTMYPLLILIPI